MEELPEHTPLRILMISDTVGGVWTYSMELCKALLQFNVHFYLVTTGALMQPAQKKMVKDLKNVTVYETDFQLEWMENPWKNIDASGDWLLELEKELQPDLIHINGYVYGSINWKAPVIVVAHSDVFSWFISVKKTQPTAEWNQYFKRVQNGINNADFLIAPSDWMMQQIHNIYTVTIPEKVIYNGRSPGVFSPAKKQQYIFSMGRIWDEAKNIKLLIDAASQIKYPIQLAGENRFANNDVSTEATNILYVGKLTQQQIAARLSTASVYVLPAKYEPFGLSILEAALSGCALVLGNIDSLKEIWSDNAIYVNTDDAGALTKTVNNLMEDEALLNHYKQVAFKHAKKYSPEVMAENYLQLYKSLVHQKRLIKQEI